MIRITVPPQIGDNTFADYVRRNVLLDARFGQTFDTLAAANEILLSLTNTDIIELTDNTYSILKECVHEPHLLTDKGLIKGYNSGAALQVFPFLAAIMNAT